MSAKRIQLTKAEIAKAFREGSGALVSSAMTWRISDFISTLVPSSFQLALAFITLTLEQRNCSQYITSLFRTPVGPTKSTAFHDICIQIRAFEPPRPFAVARATTKGLDAHLRGLVVILLELEFENTQEAQQTL